MAKRIVLWPARVMAARRSFAQLAQMSDYQLHDIGLTRQDIWNAASLPLDEDPTRLLAKAMQSRRARRRSEPQKGSDAAFLL
jgi:uncharacterized protein YjiS (DUF1127 family)